ncbi:MAG: dihydrodipicolinate reductase C-terminal domain-containing protein [Simkaniaceae bacterium]
MKIGIHGKNGKMGQAITKCVGATYSFDECEIIIDVSHPSALPGLIPIARKRKVPLVVGTTGFEDLSPLKNLSKELPLLYAPNFSLGILATLKAALLIKEIINPKTLYIIENHHLEKKDSPSGTALMLKNALGASDIFSLRTPETIGTHTLLFSNEEEEITLTHCSKSRMLFAKGALIAAKKLMKKPPGFYELSDLFK